MGHGWKSTSMMKTHRRNVAKATSDHPLLTAAALVLGAGLAVRQALRLRGRMNFDGKVVLITGGSRGLGLLLARRFGAEGAKVVICSRDQDELERARQALLSRRIDVKAIHCNVRIRAAVEDLVRTAVETFGGIDVLVNNAGVISVG